MYGDKVKDWHMRCAEKDINKISLLAKLLKVKKSVAVRLAVENMLAANKACSGFAAGRVKNKGSVKAANR
jgi:hypothetical protein